MVLLAYDRQKRLATYYWRTYRRRCRAAFAQVGSLFWPKHPALLYSLSLLLGFSFAFSHSFWLLVPFSFIALSLKNEPRRLSLFTLLALLSIFAAFENSLLSPLDPLRASTKASLKIHLEGLINNRLVTDFLLGIFSGQFKNPYLKQLLSDVGLQHILAISGFHFSLLVMLLGSLLKPSFSLTVALTLLMLFLGTYLLFIGLQPSILRAFISAQVLLLSGLLSRPSSSLNRLGLGLLAVLLYNPHFALNLGFQLSFLATAAILLFYKPMNLLLQLFFIRKLSHQEASALLPSHRLLYIIAVFFRRTLALGLAVNLTLLPVLLHTFNQFPLFSFFYNLFFPLLVTFSLLFLLLGLTFDLIGLGLPFHLLNALYTGLLLKTATGLPTSLKTVFYCSLSEGSCLIWVSCTLFFGLLINQKTEEFLL